ncbi:hypothetical protein IMZ48_08880, partial [Candidatus Bathyarchaeota archaeon]|nr:hypothetical protein [Candidatus Bathyarchaeota archaeon]
LEQLTRGLFAVTAFSTVVTDFSKPSRDRLTNIAADPSFRLAVRRIEVKNHTTSSGRTGPDRDHVPGYDDDDIWPRCTDTYYREIDVSSKRVKQFAEALLCFPNCTRAVIPDYENLGPVSPRHAKRKGSHLRFNLIQKEDISSDDAAEILLHAYSLPGAPPIRSFQALLREDTDVPASLTFTKATLDAVRKNWGTYLEGLVLQFPSYGNMETFRLITDAHSLTSLRIVWNERWEINGPPGDKLFRHLDDSPDFAPPLETLALGGITLGEEGDLLPRFLSRFQDTLVSLAFSELSLTPGAWKSVFRYLTAFPNLESLSIYNCTEGANNLVFCKMCASRNPQDLCGTSNLPRERPPRKPGT